MTLPHSQGYSFPIGSIDTMAIARTLIGVTILCLFVALASSSALFSPEALLLSHNQEKLFWNQADDNLAAGAQAYADLCNPTSDGIANRRADYAARRGVVDGGGDADSVGENVAVFNVANSQVSVDDSDWSAERKDWDCPTNTCAKGKDCSHYTQMIWSASTRLGCGASTCNSSLSVGNQTVKREWYLLVCRYNSAGNVAGLHPLLGSCLIASPSPTPINGQNTNASNSNQTGNSGNNSNNSSGANDNNNGTKPSTKPKPSKPPKRAPPKKTPPKAPQKPKTFWP